jgi:membrane-associated phospholipid phosphatase
MAASECTLRRSSVFSDWAAFLVQALIAVSVEVGDDLSRGFVSQHGTAQGIENARQIVAFEAEHGFWIEPSWQLFFEQTHRIWSFSITWLDVVPIFNGVYVLCHIFVTLLVALWIWMFRRPFFGLLRNIFIATNVFALVLYERFPVAPPRLSGVLTFNHHAFVFQDTVYGLLNGSGKLLGTGVGYNEFSAMPSLHVGWALIIAAAVILLVRPWPVKLLAAAYPVLMTLAVVVTGNHFLLDGIVAAAIVGLAALLCASIERLRGRPVWPAGVTRTV